MIAKVLAIAALVLAVLAAFSVHVGKFTAVRELALASGCLAVALLIRWTRASAKPVLAKPVGRDRDRQVHEQLSGCSVTIHQEIDPSIVVHVARLDAVPISHQPWEAGGSPDIADLGSRHGLGSPGRDHDELRRPGPPRGTDADEPDDPSALASDLGERGLDLVHDPPVQDAASGRLSRSLDTHGRRLRSARRPDECGGPSRFRSRRIIDGNEARLGM
jgi:hypothetical protein